MMTLLLGYLSYAIHKRKSLLEIGESKSPRYVMLVDYLPLWNFLQDLPQLSAF